MTISRARAKISSHERVKREALAGRSFLPHLQPKNWARF
jgi:hypothetical protein